MRALILALLAASSPAAFSADCAVPGKQDSTCVTPIIHAAEPAPSCGAGQTQVTAPTWNGSSWVGLACVNPPPAPPSPPPAPPTSSLWPSPHSYILNWLYERIVIKTNGDMTLQSGTPSVPWHDIAYLGNTSQGTSFDITAIYNQGWGGNYWQSVILDTGGIHWVSSTFSNGSYGWNGGLTCTAAWCYAGL